MRTQISPLEGRAIAQAVSRWIPTAAARVRSRVWSSLISGGQSGAGKVSSEYFGFPCQYSFHKILHHYNHPGQVQCARHVQLQTGCDRLFSVKTASDLPPPPIVVPRFKQKYW
jgi:hypothetical protein